MPFDESMFAEGQTMNMYWDQELRNRTKASFEPKIVAPVEAVEAPPQEPEEPAVEMPAADEELEVDNVVVESLDDVKRDSQVYAKSTASTVTLWVIVGVAAAFLLIVLYLRTTKKLRF